MRPSTRTRVAIGVTAAVVGGAGLWAAKRSGWFDRTPSRDQKLAAIVKTAQSSYRHISFALITDRSASDIRSTLAAMDFRGQPPAGAGDPALILDHIAELLHHRFVARDPVAYAAWRDATGYDRIAWHDIDRQWVVGPEWELRFKEEMPADLDVDTAFSAMWASSYDWGDGFNRLTGIANEPKGLTTVFGTLKSRDPGERPRVQGEMSLADWSGASGPTMRGWWRPKRDIDALAAAYGAVACAEVGVLCEFEEGPRRPMVFTYIWDPVDRAWRLQFVCVYHPGDSYRVSTMEY